MTKSWISSNLIEIGIVIGVVGLGLLMLSVILGLSEHAMRTGAALFSLFALIVIIEAIRGRKHGAKEEQK